MNKKLLQLQLMEDVKQWNVAPADLAGGIQEDMVTLIKDYLKENPSDTECLLKLALTEYRFPLADDEAAMISLKKIISYEPNNIPAILMLAYVQEHYFDVRIDVLNMLTAATPGNSQEQAMILFAQSWYYKFKDENVFVELLQKSIDFHSGFVWPHVYLGELYKEKNAVEKACFHFEEALKNIEYIFNDDSPFDILDINVFLDARIKGIKLTKANLIMIQQLYDESCQILPSIQTSY